MIAIDLLSDKGIKFSVKGHGPLRELTLPAQNLESDFKSLATEIGKWCV